MTSQEIIQAVTDPENEPSQFGTVTLATYEALELRLAVEVEAHNAANAKLAAVTAERDALRAAIPAPGAAHQPTEGQQ